MKNKSDVFSNFKVWKAMIEKQTGRVVKKLRTDNGMEFCSGEFNQFCQENGIVRHMTVPYTPQQNGVAERLNRTLLEKARCMLSNCGLEKRFWAEAVNTAAHIVNCSPHASLDMKTPEESWSGKPADYGDLKIFGCHAYAHVREGKLDPRSVKCIFLGFSPGVKGYRLWNPQTSKILVSRDVVFDENSVLKNKQDITESSNSLSFDGDQMEKTQQTHLSNATPGATIQFSMIPPGEVTQQQPSTGTTNQQQPGAPENHVRPGPGSGGVQGRSQKQSTVALEGVQTQTIASARSRREIKAPKRLIEETNFVGFACAVATELESDEPTSYYEALSSPDSDKWVEAMQEEMQSLQQNSTWRLTKLPLGKRAIKCKWIFKKKEGIPGVEDMRYKARLVAKGYSQIPGVDFNDIFSPVVKHTSIRLFLGLVARDDLELEQLDVKTAFLHGELDEEIYMEQPEGYHVKGKDHLVCKLQKSLYGLKQSPRQWYKKFDNFVLQIGFKRSDYDACVYCKRSQTSFAYLLLYVDDMLLAAKSLEEIKKIKLQLESKFHMKDLGAARKILGMEISRDRRYSKLYLSQENYVLKILERFGMDKAKAVNTPMAAHFKLSKQQAHVSQQEVEEMATIPYASAVGSLMYAMVCTRPDLAHAVSVVSRFMANPAKEHWQAVKWIFRYLKGTHSSHLEFSRDTTNLIGYVDADYAGCMDTRRSTSAYVFTFGGCAVSWRSRLQECVALSTAEAEYMALSDALKEAIWLRNIHGELTQGIQKLRIMCDSQSAIYLTKDSMFHERTKHIDVRYHKLREVLAEGDIIVEKVSTSDNAADMLTKVLTLTKFKHCLDLVSLV